MKRKFNFYFSEKQAAIEDSNLTGLDQPTYFKGQRYTESCTMESEHATFGLLKPHNERFSDSVFLGTGTQNDIKYGK